MKIDQKRTAGIPFLTFALLISLAQILPGASAQQSNYPLDEALDTYLQFTTSTSSPWAAEFGTTHDGYDAVMVTLNGSSLETDSWLQTTVTGPARVSFWWLYNVARPDGFTVSLQLDGVNVMHPQPSLFWSSNYIDVPVGNHIITWDIVRHYWSNSQLTVALDQIDVIPLEGDAPQVTMAETMTVAVGQPATLHVDTTGTEPITYHWFHNQVFIASGNEPDLPLTFNMSSRDAGTYTVIASNLFGTAEASTVVTVDYAALSDALDTPDLQWTGDWFPQVYFTHDGEDAAQSLGQLSNDTPRVLRATITGPASVSFYLAGIDGNWPWEPEVTAKLDGAPIFYSLGSNWAGAYMTVPFGDHVVSFEATGSGNGLVDQVTVTPLTGEGPAIASQSSDITVEAGAEATMRVDTVDRFGFYTFEWRLNDKPFVTIFADSTLKFPAAPSDAGVYTVVVSNIFGAVTSGPIVLTVKPPKTSLTAALDSPDLIWETAPADAPPWFGEPYVTHDHRSAAQGPDGSNLKTTVMGPGMLSFWWKTSNSVQLSEIVNPTQTKICAYVGTGEWRQETLEFSSGAHVLEWQPTGTAWLDQVRFVPGAPPPLRIVEQPKSQQVDLNDVSNPFAVIQLSVKASGPQPMTYEWNINGYVQQTSESSLFLTWYDFPQSYGVYTVTVSCPSGTVQSLPAILSPKTELSATVGEPGEGWAQPSDDSSWFVSTNVTFRKLKVLQSTPIGDGGWDAIENTFPGPGTLSFWWKVSSQKDADYLHLDILGAVQTSISSETKWQQYKCHLGVGEQTVQWVYSKDYADAEGQDCGWIADVQFTPDPPPTVRIVPHEQTVYEGSVASFRATTNSADSASLQWMFGYESFGGDTTIKVAPATVDHAGTFTLTVTGDSGTTIENATLNVKPAIAGRRVMAGSAFDMKVNYSGFKPEPFSWNQSGYPLQDDARIHGATAAVLHIANAQPADGGWYGVTLANDNVGYSLDVGGNVQVLSPGAIVGWGVDDLFAGEIVWSAEITDAISVATERTRSAAVLGDGTVRMWLNYDGSSLYVPDDLTDVVSVALAADHSVALKKDGSTVEWSDVNVPQPIHKTSVDAIRAIAASENHVLYLSRKGTVSASGQNYYGECNVPSGLKDVTAVAAGNGYSLALLRSGRIVAWGSNNSGLLMVPHIHDAVAIAAGDQHALALRRGGTVVGWGVNTSGQISVPHNFTNVVAVAAGAFHSVALTADGRVVSWGGVDDPNSGINSGSAPVGLQHVARISASANHTLTLAYAPQIITQPEQNFSEDPDLTIITVLVSGRSPLAYSWRMNGKVIANTTNAFLNLRMPVSSRGANERRIDVVVRNRYGIAISQSIPLVNLFGFDSTLSSAVTTTSSAISVPVPGVDVANAITAAAIVSTMRLSVTKQSDNIVITWPAAAGVVLECGDSIGGAFSNNIAGLQSTAGTTNIMTVPISSQQKFYRLRLP